jgi:hypothetical protein
MNNSGALNSAQNSAIQNNKIQIGFKSDRGGAIGT